VEERKVPLQQSMELSQQPNQQLNKASSVENEDPNTVKKELNVKYLMRSHMDIVRGVQFISDLDSLATVSEDCTVKLWSLKNIDQNY
jgi:WD40 repeat protein